jgi:hypothetical protein
VQAARLRERADRIEDGLLANADSKEGLRTTQAFIQTLRKRA